MTAFQITTSHTTADAGTFWVRRNIYEEDRIQNLLPYAAEVTVKLDALDHRVVDLRQLSAELDESTQRGVIVRVTTAAGGRLAQVTVIDALAAA
ncbi:hypothetical protein [Kribbella soli]|uniref:Uncharacterized protein n=1 Tax=Kribbella soli TaxID=1124743 RepID=A0A4R0GUA1_9ACTN|nr:hypothetical protein [Kribbella soli]TCC01321.1 hypothetical protein E0H45_42125 [Kribbella soli]